MPPSPAPSLSTVSRRKPNTSSSSSLRQQTSEVQTPPPVQITSASTYSASGNDDPQPNDAQQIPDSDSEEDDYPVIAADADDAPAQSLLPPPSFEPLFALITEPQGNVTHHPSVYYVFSDDAANEREGNDVATIASIKALEHGYTTNNDNHDEQADGTSDEERYIILDLAPSIEADDLELKVNKVSSLSPSWVITSTSLRPAPTFDEEVDTSSALMLRIEGLELAHPIHSASATRPGKSRQEVERKAAGLLQEARKRGGGTTLEGMSDLFGQFSKGVAVLDMINKDRPPE